MAITLTIKDSFNLTLDELIDIVPNSKAAKEVKSLRCHKDTTAKKGELKVFYEGELDQGLDKAIEKTLKEFGYKRYASGLSHNWVRELAFNNRCSKEKP